MRQKRRTDSLSSFSLQLNYVKTIWSHVEGTLIYTLKLNKIYYWCLVFLWFMTGKLPLSSHPFIHPVPSFTHSCSHSIPNALFTPSQSLLGRSSPSISIQVSKVRVTNEFSDFLTPWAFKQHLKSRGSWAICLPLVVHITRFFKCSSLIWLRSAAA